MRDIEYFTDMYYQELRRTPTGKDPIIKKFMDRWSIEELHHGNLLNRFLEEAGYPTGKNWQAEATRKIPRLYTIGSYLVDHASRPFGKYFHGAHMVWGAINEITAMNAYRRLSDLAGHPVLKQLLIGIVQEESIHGELLLERRAREACARRSFREISRGSSSASSGRRWGRERSRKKKQTT